MPTLTGDRDGTIRVADKSRGGLSSWFTGSSAAVPVGIPVGEQESSNPSTAMSSRDASPERPAAKLKKRPTLPTLDSSNSLSSTTPTKPPASSTSSTSRFNFFSSPKTPQQKTIQLPQSSLDNDELLTLDITSALFPGGSPGAQDPFSPSSFKNLLMNAEGLLLKLQTAYKLRTLSLHELSADRSAMTDELEEAETRTQCLRAQLGDMASKVAEQDGAIQDLLAQLAAEKQARSEEAEAREKSIALITSNRQEMERTRAQTSCCAHEDLGIAVGAGASKWRHSGSSSDSDADSVPESVFSRPRSPAPTTNSSSSSATSTMTTESTPELLQASFGRVVANPNLAQAQARPKIVERPSTFQKMLKNITTTEAEKQREMDVVDDMFGRVGMGESGCENCRGRDSSVAWDAVGLLRAENRGLKDRVGALEGAVEGALDLVFWAEALVPARRHVRGRARTGEGARAGARAKTERVTEKIEIAYMI